MVDGSRMMLHQTCSIYFSLFWNGWQTISYLAKVVLCIRCVSWCEKLPRAHRKMLSILAQAPPWGMGNSCSEFLWLIRTIYLFRWRYQVRNGGPFDSAMHRKVLRFGDAFNLDRCSSTGGMLQDSMLKPNLNASI